MRYSFRLAELLNYSPDLKRRPGVIKQICDRTGLERHQVAALLRNRVKNIPLDALSRLCLYLVEQGLATADQLPGALFELEAENFWELLARREWLELCIGVRRADQDMWPDGAWIVASDAVLLGELLNGVSTLGGTSSLRGSDATAHDHPTAKSENRAAKADAASPGGMPAAFFPGRGQTHLKQTLTWSPGQELDEETMARAQAVHASFRESRQDKAFLCLGSTKSNPAAELVVASAFDGTPFEPQETCRKARDRAVPFYLRYRDHDPQPASCWGGRHLADDTPSNEPGIYYETANGTWAFCASDQRSQDVAFVFYVHGESQGWLEMALGGFSGRATRLLARTLASQAHKLWPPVYGGFGRQFGAFLLKYSLPEDQDNRYDPLRTDLMVEPEIIPLAPEPFQRRLTRKSKKSAVHQPTRS